MTIKFKLGTFVCIILQKTKTFIDLAYTSPDLKLEQILNFLKQKSLIEFWLIIARVVIKLENQSSKLLKIRYLQLCLFKSISPFPMWDFLMLYIVI